MELKNPTTFEQQVSILESRNIIIDDPDLCKSFLSKVNYYRFSAYLLPFRDSEGNCKDAMSFLQLKKIYEFDSELRSLLFSAIEEIEIHLRTEFAYFHAHEYGAEGYLSSGNFNKKHNHTAFSRHVHACIDENKKTPVVRHHMKNYNGHFPIWTIIDFFSTGMLSYFYRGMKNNDKATLAQNIYGVTYQDVDSWMRCLTDLRNRCAHYSRLYYWIFPAIPKMPRNITYVPTRKLFAQIYMLKMMYPDPKKWEEKFVKPLIKLVKHYKPYINLKHMDFPYRWKSMLLK